MISYHEDLCALMESMSEYMEVFTHTCKYDREMKWCLAIFEYTVKRGCSWLV